MLLSQFHDMKAIIVEDSRLARNELKTLLKAHPAIEIIGEAVNGHEALTLIPELEPDLLFLDIQMPGMDGFELLEQLDQVPLVVFTTAYDQYAIKSFEFNTLDYLLKPIHPDRLALTIKRVEEKFIENSHPHSLMDGNHQIFVKDGEQCWIVKLERIRLMEIYGNYTRIYFENHKPMVLKSLNYLETRLDPKTFFRANRQQMVNLKWIDRLDPWLNGKLKITLKNGEEVEVSRRQSTKLRTLLSF